MIVSDHEDGQKDSKSTGGASNSVTRLGVKTQGEGRTENDSGILSEATG